MKKESNYELKKGSIYKNKAFSKTWTEIGILKPRGIDQIQEYLSALENELMDNPYKCQTGTIENLLKHTPDGPDPRSYVVSRSLSNKGSNPISFWCSVSLTYNVNNLRKVVHIIDFDICKVFNGYNT